MTDLPEVKLTVVSKEQDQLVKLAMRLSKESDGRLLRLELARNLRVAVGPAVSDIKAGALSIGQALAPDARPTLRHKYIAAGVVSSLGAAIAKGIGTQVRMTGLSAGVSVKARKKGMPRDFVNAPKRMNAESFRHPAFGRGWVEQTGSPGYFDKPLRRDHEKYRAAIIAAMEGMAARISSR